MSDINSFIQGEIDSADVVLFMKGTPVFPAMRLFRPSGANPVACRHSV